MPAGKKLTAMSGCTKTRRIVQNPGTTPSRIVNAPVKNNTPIRVRLGAQAIIDKAGHQGHGDAQARGTGR